MNTADMTTLFTILNDIEVKGAKNLNNLLAAIQLVQKIMNEATEFPVPAED